LANLSEPELYFVWDHKLLTSWICILPYEVETKRHRCGVCSFGRLLTFLIPTFHSPFVVEAWDLTCSSLRAGWWIGSSMCFCVCVSVCARVHGRVHVHMHVCNIDQWCYTVKMKVVSTFKF
jgi:hypothetical protein